MEILLYDLRKTQCEKNNGNDNLREIIGNLNGWSFEVTWTMKKKDHSEKSADHEVFSTLKFPLYWLSLFSLSIK